MPLGKQLEYYKMNAIGGKAIVTSLIYLDI